MKREGKELGRETKKYTQLDRVRHKNRDAEKKRCESETRRQGDAEGGTAMEFKTQR